MDIARPPCRKSRRALLAVAAIVAVAIATIGLSRVGPAVPAVNPETIAIDTVRQGPLVREVRGPGQLVPEQIHYVTTLMPGRVERVLVRPGTRRGRDAAARAGQPGRPAARCA